MTAETEGRQRLTTEPCPPDDGRRRAERARWEDRHARAGAPPPPSAFVARAVSGIGRPRPGALALDLACGSGRHSALLASAGWSVVALDASRRAVARALAAAPRAAGLVAEAGRLPLRPARFGLVVVTCFLERDLFRSSLASLLEPGGMLLVETFTLEHFERAGHPRREFCLTEGEIDALCASSAPPLEVLDRSRTRPGPHGSPAGLEGILARRA